MPPSDRAPAVSATRTVKSSSSRSTSSRVVSFSPGSGRRVMIVGAAAPERSARAAQDVVVEGVQRLPRLEHHVVGDVDDVADRPLPGEQQAPLQPPGRRRDGGALEQRGGEARVELGIADVDLDPAGQRRAFSLDLGRGRPQHGPGQRRDLARHAQDAGVAHHVGRDVDVEDAVAGVVGQRRAGGRRVGVEDDNALVPVGDAQLLLGADHRPRLDAADLRPSQPARRGLLLARSSSIAPSRATATLSGVASGPRPL